MRSGGTSPTGQYVGGAQLGVSDDSSSSVSTPNLIKLSRGAGGGRLSGAASPPLPSSRISLASVSTARSSLVSESSTAGGPRGEYADHYEDEAKILGVGQFGVVTRCVHRQTKRACAVKSINKRRFLVRRKVLEDLHQEIAILLSMNHDGIVRLVDVFETDRMLYLVMELMEGGDMLDYTLSKGSLSEPETKFFFLQIMRTVAYLHKQNISHRDLKPDNILLVSRDTRCAVVVVAVVVVYVCDGLCRSVSVFVCL